MCLEAVISQGPGWGDRTRIKVEAWSLRWAARVGLEPERADCLALGVLRPTALRRPG